MDPKDASSGDGSLESKQVKKKGGGSRFGRKGDPRMHRAVAARLANPELSLLEALRLGGFNYPRDLTDDSYTLDNETVSFAQRRNQLNRRLRQARNKAASDENGAENSLGAASSNNDQARIERLVAPSRSRSALFSDAKGTKRGRDMDDIKAQELERRAQAAARPRVFRFSPQFVNRGHVPPIRGSLGHIASQPLPSPLGLIPGTGHALQQDNRYASLLKVLSSRQEQRLSPSAAPTAASPGCSRNEPVSFSLALEQMSGALSSMTNKAEGLSAKFRPDSKQELALNLLRSECSSNYQRCMLLAGYAVEDTQEDSLAYKLFKFKAWSEEGRRLMREIELIERLLGDIES